MSSLSSAFHNTFKKKGDEVNGNGKEEETELGSLTQTLKVPGIFVICKY